MNDTLSIRTHSMRSAALVFGAALFVVVSHAIASDGESAHVRIEPGEPIDAASIKEAAASTEAEMKPYWEAISGPNIRFKMVPIHGGVFTMGSTPEHVERYDPEGKYGAKAETPQIQVTVEPLWMGAAEVTWDEYEVFMFRLDMERRRLLRQQPLPLDGAADSTSRPTEPYTDMTFEMGKEGFPAICMTQFAAKAYTKWLSAKTGRFYRLPSEAEWEYACRAGTTTAYSFGDDMAQLDEYGWYFDNAFDAYHQTAQKKPNAWGLYDMHGNVSEWVIDQLIADHYAKFAGKGPVPAAEAIAWPTELYPRVARGGNWDSDAQACRSASRLGSDAEWKIQDPQLPKSIWYHTDALWVGFRVVRPLVEPSEEVKKRWWEADQDDIREILELQRAERQ